MSYNSIIIFNKENDSWLKFLLTKEEFERIKNIFYWRNGPEGFIIPLEDYFTEIQLILFRNNFIHISEDFILEDYFISFYNGIYFFTPKEYLKDRFQPIKRGACRVEYEQLLPTNGRPRFEYADNFIIEWYHEYGLYKKYKEGKEAFGWFVHPLNIKHLFKNEDEYNVFIKKREEDMRKIKELKINQHDFFIRVINVYDKDTKELKYRIINDEFNRSALDSIIKPFEGDELLFFRSYKVTSEIAQYIQEMYSNPIDFQFEKNDYYLETLSAKNFIYSYDDFIKDLEIR